MSKPIENIYTITLNNVSQFVDDLTQEINMTALAEYVCDLTDGYDGDDVPEIYFKAAYEASEHWYSSFAP